MENVIERSWNLVLKIVYEPCNFYFRLGPSCLLVTKAHPDGRLVNRAKIGWAVSLWLRQRQSVLLITAVRIHALIAPFLISLLFCSTKSLRHSGFVASNAVTEP